MWRLLHFVAIAALVGSAVYAYSIKYETIWYAEQIVKTKHKIAAEHDQIAMLRATWAHLTRPERVAALVSTNLDTQPLALSQIVRISDLPEPAPKIDTIGRKLDALGLSAPTNTPHNAAASSRTTPLAKP
jgi:hypothetical protein